MLRPIGKRLLLRTIVELSDNGLIHIPDAYKQEKVIKCEVLAIGKGCEEFAGEVGDFVLIDGFTGNTIRGSTDLLVHEKNILGIYTASAKN